MKEQKDKRVLSIELNNNLKHVSITGKDSEENVVMRQELTEDDMNHATGGGLRIQNFLYHEGVDENVNCPEKH